MKNKPALILAVITGLIVILGCSKLAQLGNNGANTRVDDSKSFSSAGKEWSSFDLKDTGIKVDLPGTPKDQSPQLPQNIKELFSDWRIYSYDEKDFASSYTEIIPTGKKKWLLKDLADTSMTALKKQLPDLTYTLDIRSETNAKYNGTFKRNGKSYDLRGCCVYKKDAPARVWAILTLYPKDNTDAQAAGQRIIESVLFKDSTEQCK